MICILRFGIVFVLDFVLCVSCFYRSCLLLFYDFYINSFSFVQELLNSDLDSSKVVMASFDVTSLFTNIPLNETIDIISNRIFANCKWFQGLNRSEFEKLLTLSVKNCHFMFNGRLFHQIDGVAMGSPLDPLFANIFMSFHEKTWLDSCPSSINGMWTTAFSFSDPWITYLSFSTT